MGGVSISWGRTCVLPYPSGERVSPNQALSPFSLGVLKKTGLIQQGKKSFPLGEAKNVVQTNPRSRALESWLQRGKNGPWCQAVSPCHPPARKRQREKGLPRLSSDPQAEDLGVRPRGWIGKMSHSSARVAHGIFIAKLSADVAKGKKKREKISNWQHSAVLHQLLWICWQRRKGRGKNHL